MSSTQINNLRLPPQDIEAEMAVLGAMLLDYEAVDIALEVLEPESFYLPAHQKIFDAIKELFEKGKAIDLVTLRTFLRDKALLDEIGGVDYLAELAEVVPSAGNVRHYADIVRDKHILRQLIKASGDISEKCFDTETDASELLDSAEEKIFSIAQEREKGKEAVHIGQIVKHTVEQIDELYRKKEHVTGLSTGMKDLDKLTSGLHAGELIIVAGRPSMGKSAFAANIAEYLAVEKNVPVAFFSIEMSKEQISQRLLCSVARVDAHKVRTGFLASSDWPKITMAAGKLTEAPIYIDDSSGLSSLELRAKARRLKARHDIQLIILDYLQMMRGAGRPESRQQEISQISRSLKLLAKELNLPVIAVSQLSRAVEARQDKRPMLSDLRESGSIEQDADLVVLLMREEYYHPTEENRGIAEVIVAKQRNGQTGTIKMTFIKEYTRFEDMAGGFD